jgi:carboxypeptidase C (cathepsin A)
MHALRAGCIALTAALLGACGGGGGGGTAVPAGALADDTGWSTAASGSVPDPGEQASITMHAVMVAGASIAYTATAGHLTAFDATHAPEAAMFYVAYTAASPAGPQRPVVFFYNGGPGSATVWLHLGSFAPRRLVTNDPSTTVPAPFQLVDNAESLIDVADLVFVDAIGTGYSTAIAPHDNQQYWGVDADAGIMRDFITRWLAVNGRGASPVFLYGESYGTTRSAVLAHQMVSAGMPLDGVVLNSSILDYNANCGIFASMTVSCEGALPSYGMIGAWFQRTLTVPTDLDAYAQQLRDFATTSYGPAAQAWVQSRAAPAPSLLDQLVSLTGVARNFWQANVDLDPTSFRQDLLPGQLLGVYDARMAAPLGSALANSGDPSSAAITPAFTAAAQSLFVNELLYAASATYVLLSGANVSWNYAHDGRTLPDTVPDLGAAIAARPSLRVLSIGGYHDLSTPFHQTELDLDRLGVQPTITRRLYSGGHMTYLDDSTRPRMKAAVAAFIAGSGPIPSDARRALAQATTSAPLASPGSHAPGPFGGTSAPAAPATAVAATEPALAEGGPTLPPALRTAGPTPSPTGAALRALIEAKLRAARTGR